MKKYLLFTIVGCFLLTGCKEQQLDFYDAMFGNGLTLTQECKDYIYDLSFNDNGYMDLYGLDSDFSIAYPMYNEVYTNHQSLPNCYDDHLESEFVLRSIIERGKDASISFSNSEKQDIIAASVKYYLRFWNKFWDLEGYLPLKEQILKDFPQFTDEINKYFQLPRKNKYFGLTSDKKKYECIGTIETAIMDESFNMGTWGVDYSYDDLNIQGTTDKNTQTFTVKILDDDTLDFYSNLTPGDPVNFKITTNNNLEIIAENNSSELLENIIISKRTGLGLWTKSNASGMPMRYEVPYGIMVYLRCS